MNIPFYDFNKLHSSQLKQELSKIFAEIMENGSFVEGPYNKMFEEKFAELQGAQHCALVANGTDALEICLTALGVKNGDKVGVPGITFHATAEAVLNIGAIPVLIDVSEDTGLMDPASLKSVLNKYYLKAIIPVHIYGLPAPIEELEEICNPRGIAIIEDAAQAHGTLLSNGKPVGSSNNLTTFSFYPTKNLGAFGDAGAIVTSNPKLNETIRSLRNHGRGFNEYLFFGRNSRCDHMQAAVLFAKLKDFALMHEMRQNVAKQYSENLNSNEINVIGKNFLSSSSWHLFPVLFKNQAQRDATSDFLKEKGVATMKFYVKSLGEELPLQKCFGENHCAAAFSKKVLCLPIHPFITPEQISYICDNVRESLQK